MASSTASLTRESKSGSEDSDVDPAAVRRAIQRRAGKIERRELDHAITRLESRGELTDEQKTVLEEMAAAIVAGVLEGPASALAEEGTDERTLRLARELLTGT